MWKKILILFVFALVSADAFSETNDREQVMVVLDASGSMWGKVEGKTKIEIVRESYGKLVKSWEEQPIDAGLIVYGHRRKGDCSDIEVITEPKPVDAVSLGRTVYKLNPKGKTPLGEAVRMAAEKLKYKEQKATVILLSDGIETCGVDPCLLGKDLEELGIDFTTHVVGFDIEEKDKAKLQCLAENTGGQYFDAQNEQQLNQALTSTSKKVTEIKSENVVIRATTTDLGEEVSEVKWKLQTNDKVYDFVTPTNTIDLTKQEKDLPSGKYTVTASAKGYLGQHDFSLPHDRSEIVVEMSRKVAKSSIKVIGQPALGSEFQVEWLGHGGKTDAIVIVPIDGMVSDSLSIARLEDGSNPATLVAPNQLGDYQVLYVFDVYGQQRIDARVNISVVPTQFSLKPVESAVVGKPLLVKWVGPGAQGDMIAIGPKTQSTDDYFSLAWINKGSNTVELRTPEQPGEYELRYFNRQYELLYFEPIIVK